MYLREQMIRITDNKTIHRQAYIIQEEICVRRQAFQKLNFTIQGVYPPAPELMNRITDNKRNQEGID
jgi:hypothetical protein